MTALLDPMISTRLQAPDYPHWRALVQAAGGCAKPVRLTGSHTILDRDGAILLERARDVFAPCGNRRASVCPACSDRSINRPELRRLTRWRGGLDRQGSEQAHGGR